jgi:hypothetical protein
MKITITLPDRIGAGLQAAADEFDMSAADFLKSVLFAASNLQQGYQLRLKLPPMERPVEPELPGLFGGETQEGKEA